MSSVPEIQMYSVFKLQFFGAPTVSDFRPVANTLKRDHDNRVVFRMSQGIGKRGQWPMIQSNVVLKSLQPIAICRPMGSHIKEKCIYIRLCIRLIHSVFGSIVRDSQDDRRGSAQCLKPMRKSIAGTCIKHFADPRVWLSYSCTRCNRGCKL